MLFSRRLAFALVTVCLAALGQAQAAPQRYVNVVNNRFATVSSGPQSSLIVDVAGDAPAASVDTAVQRQVRADWQSRARALRAQVAQMQRAGLLKPNDILPVSTLVTVRQGGRLVIPARQTRAFGGGNLTFRYTGWTDAEVQVLEAVRQRAYPLIVGVYGAPAWSGQVEVVKMGDGSGVTDQQQLAFGAYDVSHGKILLPVYGSPESEAQAYLLLMVHAFHGPATFAYDAWEQGFARAAASIVARNATFGFRDASANSLYSLLKWYDLLNQPTLGNPTFFPPSSNVPLETGPLGNIGIGKMLAPRLGMSGAAWLKVYIENQNFFAQFNAAYYNQLNGQANLTGDIPTLKNIAANIVANVEGQSFAQWYAQQYVLDTSVSLGNKLYAFVIPGQPTPKDGRLDQSTLIALVYFRTHPDGDEELLPGRAYATYFDSANARLNLGPSSEQAEIVVGEGFFTTFGHPTGDGKDAQRFTMDFHVGNESARSYTNFGLSGDFQAIVLGTVTGSVALSQATLPPVTTRPGGGNIVGGTMSSSIGTLDNDLAVSVITVADAANNKTTFRRNTGDGVYYAVLNVNGSMLTVKHTFPAGLQLVSFPVRPLTTDIASALSLPVTDFLLSFWDPTKTLYQTYASGLATGPTVAPLQPGRGYWLKSIPTTMGATAITATATGTLPGEDTDLTVALGYGWNLIGTPYGNGTQVADLLVQYLQNDAQAWPDAVKSNHVAATIFGYTPAAGYGGVSQLDQWSGYWVRVYEPSGVNLIIPRPGTRAVRRSRSADSAAIKPDWSVRLRASGDRGVPAAAVFGAARGVNRGFDNRLDVEAPPAIAPALAVEFPHPDWGRAAGRYLADFRDANSSATWDLSVTSPAGGDVTLTWQNLGAIPRRLRLTLVDKVSGTRTLLRSRSSYLFSATAGQSRMFQIVAEPARSLPLAISDVLITKTRGVTNGVTLSYAVTDTAEVTVDVLTLSGRALRRLSGGRAVSAGRQSQFWDGRSADGSALPAGNYQLQITARGEDGSLVRQIRPVLMLH